MRKTIKIFFIAIFLLFMPIFIFGFNARSVYAVSENELYNKALLNAMYNCYKEGEMWTAVKAGGSDGFVSFANSILRRGQKTDAIYIPTSIGTGNNLDEQSNGTRIGCYELFLGDKSWSWGSYGGSMTGLFELYGKTVPDGNSGALASFLQNIGYTEIKSEGGTKSCINAEYKNADRPGDSYQSAGSICWLDDDLNGTKDERDLLSSYEDNHNDSSEIYMSPAPGDASWGLKLYFYWQEAAVSSYSNVQVPKEDYYTIDDIKALAAQCDYGCDLIWPEHYNGTSWETTYYSVRTTYSSEPAGSAFQTYSMTRPDQHSGVYRNAYYKAREFLSGNGEREEFSDVDKYELYSLYLSKVYKVEMSNTPDCQNTKPSQAVVQTSDGTKYFVYTTNGWCRVTIDWNKASGNTTVSGFTKDQKYNLDTYYDFEGLIEAMFNLNLDADSGADIINPGTGVIDYGDNTKPKATCGNSGGAGSLGWIVCPILDWMKSAAVETYNNYLEPNLRVEPGLFNNNDNSGAMQGWSIFQGIANGLFIIMFLVVIFSQLTGVGIDNYGIKKILPKLIVAAILVNLSYYICVISVDLSNILGNGLKSLFDNLPANVPAAVTNAINIGDEVGSTFLSVGLLAALGAGTAWVVWNNPAILLSLLVGALGVLISILFLFVLLAGRQAAVVVLTVISPLAFVCYILPNTKKLFDKWVKLGEGLLLVYPIAGLLVGGGNYASRLLLSTGIANDTGIAGFAGALMAMLMGIVPIFFIPTVLRGSFAAMGNLGAKISGFGDRLRNGVTGGIRNSDMYKRGQTRINSGIDRNGNLTRFGAFRARVNNSRFGRRLGADRRQAAYIAQAKKNLGESEAAGAMLTGALARTGIAAAGALPDSGSGDELGPTFGAGTESAYYGANFLNSARANDITGMNAAIEAMRSSGMKAKDIAKILRYAQNHGYYNGIEQNTRAAWMRDVSKKYGNDFMATDFELNHFMATGGPGNGRALGGYGDYASTNAFGIDDVKPEDVLKLSGDSLAGMISAGKIDQGMAQRVMAMNPNMSADKRIMLGALASGSVGPGVNVDQFKADAKALASNRSATSTTIVPSGSETLATLVARWTAPTAQRATVVQEFFGPDDGQIEPVDVRIDHSSSSTSTPPPTILGPDGRPISGGPKP